MNLGTGKRAKRWLSSERNCSNKPACGAIHLWIGQTQPCRCRAIWMSPPMICWDDAPFSRPLAGLNRVHLVRSWRSRSSKPGYGHCLGLERSRGSRRRCGTWPFWIDNGTG
jgi:hypothetical protein